MNVPRIVLMLASVATLAAGVPAQQQMAGRVEAKVRAGTPAATAVVYAEPIDAAGRPRAVTMQMAQKNKAFAPRVLGVPVGSTVEFPNTDPIFHNVFSVSSPEPFDLGLYRAGASKARTFTEAAAYHVFCNIHPQMVGFIVVAPSPWVTTAGPDGAWRLDVPAGRYRVTALSERATPVSVDVRSGADGGQSIVIKLDESTFAQTTHLDKFGKPYPASAYKDK